MVKKTKKQIEKELEETEKKAAELRSQLKAKKRKYLTCANPKCKKRSAISNITAVQTYNREDGGYCIGDIYHKDDIDFLCPKCGLRNRMVPQDLIKPIKKQFKEVIDDDKVGNEKAFVNYPTGRVMPVFSIANILSGEFK